MSSPRLGLDALKRRGGKPRGERGRAAVAGRDRAVREEGILRRPRFPARGAPERGRKASGQASAFPCMGILRRKSPAAAVSDWERRRGGKTLFLTGLPRPLPSQSHSAALTAKYVRLLRGAKSQKRT